MHQTLLKLRLIQLLREIKSIGAVYSILIGCVLCIVGYAVYKQYQQAGHAWYVSGFIMLSILQIQLFRPDKDFIRKHISRPGFNMFLEYAIFSLPFACLSLFTKQWFHFPLLLLSYCIIATIRWTAKKRTALPQLARIIPASNFEWISGIRKQYALLFFLLLLAILTCWVKFAPLIFLWLFTIAVMSFYQESEPLDILLASGKKSGRAFLYAKVKAHTRLLLSVLLPVLIINSCIHPELAWVNLVFVLMQLSLLLFAILLKYSMYEPNQALTGNNVILSVVSIGSALPFLLPLPWLMSVRSYGKAINNLNQYLHDQHS